MIPSPGILVRPGASARIILATDTQYMTRYDSGMWQTFIDYLVEASPDLVLIAGDCADTGADVELVNFAQGIAQLNAAGIKWILSPGNHDYYDLSVRASYINNRVAPGAWITGLYQAGHIENSYTLITLGGKQWLILALEWSPRTATVAWASGILSTYSTVPAILMTHCYLYGADGTRYDYALKGETQPANPHSPGYNTTPAEGNSDGQDLWVNLVKIHSNVRIVLSGHSPGGQSFRSDLNDAGLPCVQVCGNYQYEERHGDGWLTEINLDNHNNMVTMRGYSPYLRRTRTVAGATLHESIG